MTASQLQRYPHVGRPSLGRKLCEMDRQKNYPASSDQEVSGSYSRLQDSSPTRSGQRQASAQAVPSPRLQQLQGSTARGQPAQAIHRRMVSPSSAAAARVINHPQVGFRGGITASQRDRQPKPKLKPKHIIGGQQATPPHPLVSESPACTVSPNFLPLLPLPPPLLSSCPSSLPSTYVLSCPHCCPPPCGSNPCTTFLPTQPLPLLLAGANDDRKRTICAADSWRRVRNRQC